MEHDYPPQPPSRPSKGLSPRFGGRSALVLLAALLCVGVTLRLGFWQLDRAAQKQSLQREIDERSALPMLDQTALADTTRQAAAQNQRRVRLRGVWIATATIFLDNRQMNARPGFFVLTPLRLERDPVAEGAPVAPSAVIWVQRGWAARDNNVRSRLPEVPTPAGSVEVVGRVAPPPARLFELGPDGQGPIRQNLDLAASAIDLAQPVLPMTVLQTADPASGPDGLLREWAAPAVDVHKHHGYAFQWFALCAVIVALYAWLQIIRPRWLGKQRETV